MFSTPISLEFRTVFTNCPSIVNLHFGGFEAINGYRGRGRIGIASHLSHACFLLIHRHQSVLDEIGEFVPIRRALIVGKRPDGDVDRNVARNPTKSAIPTLRRNLAMDFQAVQSVAVLENSRSNTVDLRLDFHHFQAATTVKSIPFNGFQRFGKMDFRKP